MNYHVVLRLPLNLYRNIGGNRYEMGLKMTTPVQPV